MHMVTVVRMYVALVRLAASGFTMLSGRWGIPQAPDTDDALVAWFMRKFMLTIAVVINITPPMLQTCWRRGVKKLTLCQCAKIYTHSTGKFILKQGARQFPFFLV